jgi:mRNA interferase RelE/StbE
MATYRVEIKKSAQKEILALPRLERFRIVAKIQALALDPRGPESKKLSAQERYRVRQGKYRILYEIRDEVLVVTIVRVPHRKEAYR